MEGKKVWYNQFTYDKGGNLQIDLKKKITG